MNQKNKFFHLLANRGYKILGQYVDSHTKLLTLCPNGHKYIALPYSFKAGHGCSICAGINKDKAQANFIKITKERNYSIIGPYINTMTKIDMVCPKGHSCTISPDNFKNGKGCRICASYGYDNSKAGYLYVLRGEQGHIKIGISNRVKQRIKRLNKETPFNFDTIYIFKGDGEDVEKCEKAFKRTYKKVGLSGFDGCTEWLNIPDFSMIDFLPPLFNLQQETRQ